MGLPPDRESPRLLLASLAHELAHGMSVTSSNAETAIRLIERTAKEGSSLSPDQADIITRCLRAIKFEASTQLFEAQKMLAAVNPDTALGFGRPSIIEASPADLLVEMLPDYDERAKGRGIHFNFEDDQHEPMPSIRLELTAIRRTFHNALSNAIKYSYATARDSNARSIRIWCKRHDPAGDFWAIRFQNYGIGFSTEEAHRFFRRGYRGRQAEREGVFGMGLGLYDVQACMKLHGGRATIDSVALPGGAYLTTLALIFPRHTTISRSQL